MKSKILVVAANPDDEVLGCGGTIARLANEGNDVFIAIMGEGITSRNKNNELSDKKEISNLHKQSQKVSDILGAKKLFMFSLPDNKFDTLPLLQVIKCIEKLIHKVKPKIIFTHASGDLNIDHQITNRAVITATRPVKNIVTKDIFTFETPSATDWSFDQSGKLFNPSKFFDISETLDLKLKAMSVYKGESRPFPHPRSEKA